jgi:hypothetical protein
MPQATKALVPHASFLQTERTSALPPGELAALGRQSSPKRRTIPAPAHAHAPAAAAGGRVFTAAWGMDGG